MRSVDEAVADRVGEGQVPDGLMPRLEGELGGDERRGALGAVLQDLEDIVALRPGKRGQGPVVEHEQAVFASLASSRV